MITYTGTLEFQYFGEIKRVEYHMTNLGGAPHIYFEDKHGHQHQFFYRSTTKEWLYGCNRGPYWPAEFMAVLFAAMDLAKERHGL